MSKRYVVAVPHYMSALMDAYYQAESGDSGCSERETVLVNGVEYLIINRLDGSNISSKFDIKRDAIEFAERVNLMGFWKLGKNGGDYPTDKAIILGLAQNAVWC